MFSSLAWLGGSCSIKCKQSRVWPAWLWTGHMLTPGAVVSSRLYFSSHQHEYKKIESWIKRFSLVPVSIYHCTRVPSAACDTQSWILPRQARRGHPKWSCSYQWARSVQQSAVRAAVIISTHHSSEPSTYLCTRNGPIRGLDPSLLTNERTADSRPWSWLITLRKLIISKVKFLSPPLLVLGAMNTNFINLLNITNFTSHHPPPISASEKSWEEVELSVLLRF